MLSQNVLTDRSEFKVAETLPKTEKDYVDTAPSGKGVEY